MIARTLRAGLLIAALGVAGCTESTLNVAGGGANAQLPQRIVKEMRAKGMSRSSPILARVFKEENKLEIWKQKTNGRYDMIASYDICKMSGKLGPKFIEGDRQSPEGFYTVRPGQMNPNSQFHLAFNIGYPNAYDRAHGRTGSNLMVHGACSSSGCFSMNDAQITEIYAFARDSFRGGQTEFQVQSFPFRMTAANMARYRNDPNYKFWEMLKEGYDHFEISKVPPKVDVCEKRYVFNRIAPGAAFSPAGACPASTMPDQLATAYQTYRSTYDAAFSKAVSSSSVATKASITGLTEAKLVSDWTTRRARGERVSMQPPSMAHDGTVSVTSRMGRIDSPAGRRMAAVDAEKAAKERAAEQKRLAKQREEEAKQLAASRAAEEKAAAEQAAQVPSAEPAPAAASPATAQAAPAQQPEEKTGILGGMRKRLTNIFGS
ncbi:L,D-transpeptidase family protein [Arvimicrobium flavum]|uniref:L,D-transpeptidase family protein n=1 Tax=Arvimicrobium flavum TaxID=3393320 RepID=UPI00237A5E0C|nr:murein L,D-transpeptidase family protein [Mesorhizobium shangrilense]